MHGEAVGGLETMYTSDWPYPPFSNEIAARHTHSVRAVPPRYSKNGPIGTGEGVVRLQLAQEVGGTVQGTTIFAYVDSVLVLRIGR
jgi:hypothetical protein